ncbi:ImmA/IrrE family metallo-endopeptidase [Saccharothrix violaceirubra]|uniref:IrrE N-terminal-like domain-containing protein n=1 Tax=Saccharothrix violaceirubra TaxID=413306 RepID=A0A7W7WY89_9PSEU|nr:hypothetical protein [Saccharothrix violaceirubra]MBB4967458.1 hypothetical protein [Saccharothrix violaceirubra]
MKRLFRRRSKVLPTIGPYDDVRELCESLGARRGRVIELVAMPLSPLGMSGLWLAAADVDIVCYESGTSRPHQDHIILHELGHILYGHAQATEVADALAPMFTALDPGVLRVMLARRHHTFGENEEREAEDFAYATLALRRDPNDTTPLMRALEG